MTKQIVATFALDFIKAVDEYPKADGNSKTDQIAIIATTFSYKGENKTFLKSIISLENLNNLKSNNIDVKLCDTEPRLLLEWRNLIKKMNPDIIIGYHICGFDFRYLRNRSKYFGIENEFCRLSKTDNNSCKFIEKMFMPHELGSGHFDYYEMIGREIIDILKVLERNFDFDSYELSHVVSLFGTVEEFKKINTKYDENNLTKLVEKSITECIFVNTLFNFLTKNNTINLKNMKLVPNELTVEPVIMNIFY